MVHLHTESKLKFDLAGIVKSENYHFALADFLIRLTRTHVVFFLRNECLNYDCHSRLQLQTKDSDVSMKYMYPCTTNKGRCMMHDIDLFLSI